MVGKKDREGKVGIQGGRVRDIVNGRKENKGQWIRRRENTNERARVHERRIMMRGL